jgi:T5SS/PEP-CTERM-associated repeat protein
VACEQNVEGRPACPLEIEEAGAILNAGSGVTVGQGGNGALLVNGGARINRLGTIDLISGTSGGSASVVVDGAGSSWTSNGDLIVGDAGLGSLAIEAAGTATTSGGVIIADTASASGSSVNVVGTGSTWQIGGTLDVGLAGAGAFSINAGGAVTAGVIIAGTALGGFGDVVVNGNASQLTATGDFIVGDHANADVALNGGGTITAGTIDIGLNPGASGVVDVEGDSVLTAVGVLNVGDAGNAVLSLGADATVNATSFNVGTAGVLVEFGDPINSGTVTNSNSIVVASGSNTTTATARFVNNGLVEVENSGTETITTPLVTNTGSLTGTMQISTGGDLVLNAGSVVATQTIQFADATGTLTIGPGGIGGFDAVIQGFVVGDTIIVNTPGPATFSQSGSVVSVIENGGADGVHHAGLAGGQRAVLPGGHADRHAVRRASGAGPRGGGSGADGVGCGASGGVGWPGACAGDAAAAGSGDAGDRAQGGAGGERAAYRSAGDQGALAVCGGCADPGGVPGQPPVCGCGTTGRRRWWSITWNWRRTMCCWPTGRRRKVTVTMATGGCSRMRTRGGICRRKCRVRMC